MINMVIAIGLFILAFMADNSDLLIASGLFAVAAEISHYRYERFKEDITDEV